MTEAELVSAARAGDGSAWEALLRAIAAPELASDPRFPTVAARSQGNLASSGGGCSFDNIRLDDGATLPPVCYGCRA